MVFSSIPAYLDPANWQQQVSSHHAGNSSSGNHNIHQLLQPVPAAHVQQQQQQPVPSLPVLLPAQQQQYAGGGQGSSSSAAGSNIRPGSMAERARLANIAMPPEAALQCPRCESSNTKFCYFNNYSLTQPRHFCKTCRRYWTRGGALRSVPVGGGCRRNKRTTSKSTSTSTSKSSPAATSTSADRQTTSSNSNSATTVSSNGGTPGPFPPNNMLGGQIQPLRFLSPLSSGGQLSINNHYSPTAAGDHHNIISLNNYGGGGGNVNNNSAHQILMPGETSRMNNFQVGPNMCSTLLGCGLGGLGGVGSLLSGGDACSSMERWRTLQQAQQFPNFLGAGLEYQSSHSQEAAAGLMYGQVVLQAAAASSMEPAASSGFLVGETMSQHDDQVRPKLSGAPINLISREDSVKMENHHHHQNQELNLLMSRQLSMGIPLGSHDQWITTAAAAPNWTTDLTSFSSSNSTTNPL